ncbi:MAG: thrombospondin type 3 repeat-containing protein [Planctomycetota bacterium]
MNHRTPSLATLLSTALGAALTGTCMADVTINLQDFSAGALQFTEVVPAGSLTGSLTSVTLVATLVDTREYTFAQDLCVYVCNGPLAFGGPLQLGGFFELGLGEYEMWHGKSAGESHVVGTTVNATCTLASPLEFSGSKLTVFVGNGYGTPRSFATWTGYVVLHGLDVPGALDTDQDGVPNASDNCPTIANPSQFDCNGDGIGDACEWDIEDCNANGHHDGCDLEDILLDSNQDGHIDSCQYARGDLNLDATVDGSDLGVVLSNWLANPPSQPDITGDGIFDGQDLATVLSNWGAL